jgi:indolepyruvate ferredoxin oxidoreductase
MFKAFGVLARFKFLRGTALDPFGRTKERKEERRLIEDYMGTMRELAAGLTAENQSLASEIARLPERIRGYGHIKDAAIVAAKDREAALLASFRHPAPAASAAE